MKKLIFYLMALLLPLSAFEMSADDENAVMKIPLELDIEQNFERQVGAMLVECYYYGMMNTIITNVWSDLGNVTLTITNCSTGSVWYDTFDSALEPQTVLILSGEPGIYEIVYITESGGVYEGTFTIQ